ncbi:hypothetical protein HanRHA438_Chr06g0274741 [Helianthus annuus]|nr:hypothetical protein HanRHA438_Chr06g0274741 [Helianthus annuus]
MPRHRRIRSDDVEPMTLSPILLKINNPSKKKNKQQIYILAYRGAVFLSLSMEASHSVGCCYTSTPHMYVFVFVCVCVVWFEFWFGFVSLCTKFRW